APSGLAQLPLATHGLRRGLHSYAASRLDAVSLIHFSDDHRAMTQTPPGLESFLPLFPALKRWAKLGRPSGAAFSRAWFHQTVQKRVLTRTLSRLRCASTPSTNFPRRRRGKPRLYQVRSVLGRALRLGRRSRASGELLQAVALVARRGSNCRVVLRQFDGAVCHLKRLRIFSLLIQRQRQAENHHWIRVARVGVDRLLQIRLRSRIIVFLEVNGSDNRIRLRAHISLGSVDLLLRRARRHLDVGVHRRGGLLRHGDGFAKALISVDIRVVRSLRNHLGDDDQSRGIVRVQAEHFAAHGLGLLGVVGILVESHRVLIKQYANFAIGELGGKIVRRLLHGGRIGNGYRRFVGIELGLGLGLRRTLGRWPRRRLTCGRRVLLRRLCAGLGRRPNRETQYPQTQYC